MVKLTNNRIPKNVFFVGKHKVEIETSKFSNLDTEDNRCYEHSNYTNQELNLLGTHMKKFKYILIHK